MEWCLNASSYLGELQFYFDLSGASNQHLGGASCDSWPCLIEPWVAMAGNRLCLGLCCGHDHGYGLFDLSHSCMFDICLGGRASRNSDFFSRQVQINFLSFSSCDSLHAAQTGLELLFSPPKFRNFSSVSHLARKFFILMCCIKAILKELSKLRSDCSLCSTSKMTSGWCHALKHPLPQRCPRCHTHVAVTLNVALAFYIS